MVFLKIRKAIISSPEPKGYSSVSINIVFPFRTDWSVLTKQASSLVQEDLKLFISGTYSPLMLSGWIQKKILMNIEVSSRYFSIHNVHYVVAHIWTKFLVEKKICILNTIATYNPKFMALVISITCLEYFFWRDFRLQWRRNILHLVKGTILLDQATLIKIKKWSLPR